MRTYRACSSSIAMLVSLTASSHAQTRGGRTLPPPAAPETAKTVSTRAEALSSRVDFVPAGRYADLLSYVTHAGAEGGTLFNSPDGETSYLVVRRTKPSDVEEHSRWDDVIIVRSGAGTLAVGTRATGARFLSAGELRGGAIVKPSLVILRPGDIARIPAGVPHAFTPAGTDPWEFLLLKVRRPNKPLKRPPEPR